MKTTTNELIKDMKKSSRRMSILIHGSMIISEESKAVIRYAALKQIITEPEINHLFSADPKHQ